jgi:hypothetical protein
MGTFHQVRLLERPWRSYATFLRRHGPIRHAAVASGEMIDEGAHLRRHEAVARIARVAAPVRSGSAAAAGTDLSYPLCCPPALQTIGMAPSGAAFLLCRSHAAGHQAP